MKKLIYIFFLAILFMNVKGDEGILIYNPGYNGIGFGYYTENLDLKNISKGLAQNGASLSGVSSIKINNELMIIGFGKISLIKNQNLGDLIIFTKNSYQIPFPTIIARSIESFTMLSESKFIIVGLIDSFGNIPANNALKCDFISKICTVVFDGIQNGLPLFSSLISSSYDNDGIVYYTYSGFNKNNLMYNSYLVSWNENTCKKKIKNQLSIFLKKYIQTILNYLISFLVIVHLHFLLFIWLFCIGISKPKNSFVWTKREYYVM
jgi:hypothetical protein